MASGQKMLDELAGIDFLGDDEYREWTKKTIEMIKALTMQVEAGRQLLRPQLEATPTAEGWRSNSLTGSRKAARTVFTKLGRAGKSLTFAAGQVAAAYRSFERDYFGEVAGIPQQTGGMRIGNRGAPGSNNGHPGQQTARQQTQAFWAPS